MEIKVNCLHCKVPVKNRKPVGRTKYARPYPFRAETVELEMVPL